MKQCDLCLKQVDNCDAIQVREIFTETPLGYCCLICFDKILAFRNLFPDEFNISIDTYRFNYFELLKHVRGLCQDAKTK